MKHTNGPWYTLGKSVMYNEINTFNGRDSRQRQLAEVYTANGEADASLIAAAPELLEIAQLILKEWERPTAGVLPGALIARLSQYSDLARAAIAKATGEL